MLKPAASVGMASMCGLGEMLGIAPCLPGTKAVKGNIGMAAKKEKVCLKAFYLYHSRPTAVFRHVNQAREAFF